VLLNLSSLYVYQFPFVVAAGAVAEELFFRVGVQVIATCGFLFFIFYFLFFWVSELLLYISKESEHQ
jgi:hypothetical protein